MLTVKISADLAYAQSSGNYDAAKLTEKQNALLYYQTYQPMFGSSRTHQKPIFSKELFHEVV